VRKTLTLALLALVLVSLVTATWMGVAAVVLGAPVEISWLAPLPPVGFVPLVAVPLLRPTATALLRGPPSSELVPRTTRTLDQESAWPRSDDSRRSSPT
jgi:hypothetical protein